MAFTTFSEVRGRFYHIHPTLSRDLGYAFNRVQWYNPNTASSNFGEVTQQWNTPRWIQFHLRFVF